MAGLQSPKLRMRVRILPPLPKVYAELLEWQTGSVEVAVSVRAYGFKSHVPHH